MSLSDELYGIPESNPDLYASRDIKTIARRWDSKAAQWDLDLKNKSCHINNDNSYGYFMEAGRQLVLARQELCMNGSMVDLGCGTGGVLTEFSHFFYNSIGVDISQEMLNIAASKNIQNAEWRLDDIFEGAWCKQRHVAIFSRGILLSHYGNDLAKLLIEQTGRTLASGGFALFDFLSSEAPESTRIFAPNKSYYSTDWLINQAACSGFRNAIVTGNTSARVRYLILEKPVTET